MFAEAGDRLEGTLNLVEGALSIEPSPKDLHNKKAHEEARSLNMAALQDRTDRELESRKSHALAALAVQGEQQRQKSGARHIQSHVGSVNRRQQGRRDTKNS